MRAVRCSPWFRIFLLSLAVLFAHTGHAATGPILPACHPNTLKVGATRLESEKKVSLAITRLATPGRLAQGHTLFNGSFGLTGATAILCAQATRKITVVRATLYIPPQRLPFDLRI